MMITLEEILAAIATEAETTMMIILVETLAATATEAETTMITTRCSASGDDCTMRWISLGWDGMGWLGLESLGHNAMH